MTRVIRARRLLTTTMRTSSEELLDYIMGRIRDILHTIINTSSPLSQYQQSTLPTTQTIFNTFSTHQQSNTSSNQPSCTDSDSSLSSSFPSSPAPPPLQRGMARRHTAAPSPRKRTTRTRTRTNTSRCLVTNAEEHSTRRSKTTSTACGAPSVTTPSSTCRNHSAKRPWASSTSTTRRAPMLASKNGGDDLAVSTS
ncbi:uncharacterized protein J3D65DRAFT_173412 [Phyllosticta citribraziliensis]|uniref:Uncharacterized protein n=1 Tax=Phyllosticta citribraziliensis TaxID=989973 RepID=A0ABR1L4I4_9PEZI